MDIDDLMAKAISAGESEEFLLAFGQNYNINPDVTCLFWPVVQVLRVWHSVCISMATNGNVPLPLLV